LCENCISTFLKDEVGPFPHSNSKINSKSIGALRVRAQSIKLLEENSDLILGSDDFLDMTPKTLVTKG
jgi:hypothetical protein